MMKSSRESLGGIKLERIGLTLLLFILVSGAADFVLQTPVSIQKVTWIPIFDAYTQVSVFVAATLLIFFGLETYLKIDVGQIMQDGEKWQVSHYLMERTG